MSYGTVRIDQLTGHTSSAQLLTKSDGDALYLPVGSSASGSSVSTRTALAALPSSAVAVILTESGREGIFVWDSTDRSALVSADTAQGLAVAPSSNTTGASGAWIRKFNGPVNVRWFGAKADGTTNDSGAFTAALTAINSLATSGYGYGNTGGSALFIPTGVYWLNTTTLDITFGLIIEGESTGLTAPGSTVLKWADNTTGIRAQEQWTTGDTGVLGSPRSSSGRVFLRNLTLYGAYTSTESESHGIQARTVIHVEDVSIYNFSGDGVHIVADAVANKGNANAFYLKRVFTQNNRNGIYVSGGDTNAGGGEYCYGISNRRWNLWDNSFLGNTWIGCSADNGGLVPGSTPSVVSYSGNRYCVVKDQGAGASTNAPSGTTADNAYWYYMGAGGVDSGNNIPAWSSGTTYRDGGSFRCESGGNAGNVFIGSYHEGGQGYAQIDSCAVVIGKTLTGQCKGVPVVDSIGGQFRINGSAILSNLNAYGNSHVFGNANTAAISDTVVYVDSTNVNNQLLGRSWFGPSPTNVGTLNFRWGFGNVYDVYNDGWGHRFRINGTDAMIVDTNGATMTSGHNITYTEIAASSVPAPAAGTQTVFIDTADHKLKRKDSSGTITIIG